MNIYLPAQLSPTSKMLSSKILKKDQSGSRSGTNYFNSQSFLKPSPEPKKRQQHKISSLIGDAQAANPNPKFQLGTANKNDTLIDRYTSFIDSTTSNFNENSKTERRKSKFTRMKKTIEAIHSVHPKNPAGKILKSVYKEKTTLKIKIPSEPKTIKKPTKFGQEKTSTPHNKCGPGERMNSSYLKSTNRLIPSPIPTPTGNNSSQTTKKISSMLNTNKSQALYLQNSEKSHQKSTDLVTKSGNKAGHARGGKNSSESRNTFTGDSVYMSPNSCFMKTDTYKRLNQNPNVEIMKKINDSLLFNTQTHFGDEKKHDRSISRTKTQNFYKTNPESTEKKNAPGKSKSIPKRSICDPSKSREKYP